MTIFIQYSLTMLFINQSTQYKSSQTAKPYLVHTLRCKIMLIASKLLDNDVSLPSGLSTIKGLTSRISTMASLQYKNSCFNWQRPNRTILHNNIFTMVVLTQIIIAMVVIVSNRKVCLYGLYKNNHSSYPKT